MGTKESLWLSHTLLVTLTLCPASCLCVPSRSTPTPQLWLYIKQPLIPCVHTPKSTHVLGGFRTCFSVFFFPTRFSSPLRALCPCATLTDRTVGGTVLFTSLRRLLSITPLHTATTHVLTLATNRTVPVFGIFSTFLSSRVSQIIAPLLLSAVYLTSLHITLRPFTTIPSPVQTDAPITL